jgi:molybdopterin converting factor subunit 1
MSDAPASGPVRVRVRLFAMQRELAGTRELGLELPARATVEDAWVAVVERIPALAPGRTGLRFARNGEYAAPETALEDGDEVACIPPVSGGAGSDPGSEDPGRRRIIELREGPLDGAIVAELSDRLATAEDGAVVAFLGRTRVTPGTPAPGQEAEAARFDGETVEALEYEAHESMAVRQLERIADEIETRYGVHRLAIVHRLGEVPLGDVSVAIVVASPHRGEAFEAARYAMDETKARVPIWKVERFAGGRVWVGRPAREGPPPAGDEDER